MAFGTNVPRKQHYAALARAQPKPMSHWVIRFVLAGVGTVCFFVAAVARPQNPLGAVRGIVVDASGGRVPTAIVSAKNPERSLIRQNQADARGEFRLEDLPRGSYALSVSAPGFAEARSVVTVAVSSVTEVSVVLRPKTVAEKVMVSAAPESITTEPLDTASAVHQTLPKRELLRFRRAGVPA